MRNLKKGLYYWKHGLRKIRVSVTAVIGVCLLTSCCSQKEIAQPTVRIVETHSIDTCFVVNSDTCFVIETDTLRVETIIRDTLVFQKIETKPIIVRDTITQVVQKTDKVEEKAQKTDKTNSWIGLLGVLCLIGILLCISNKK